MARARLTDPSYSVIFERERRVEGRKKKDNNSTASTSRGYLLSPPLWCLGGVEYNKISGPPRNQKSDGVLPFVQATNNKFGRRVKVAAAADEKVSSPNNGRLDFFSHPLAPQDEDEMSLGL